MVGRRGRALLGLFAGSVLLTGLAARAAEGPPAAPPYPTKNDAAGVVEWLKAHTTVPPETVIAFGPDFVFSLAPGADSSGTPGVVRRTVREEVLSPNFAATMRGRSSLQILDFDCKKRRFKPVMISVYEGANLQGKAERVALADQWTADQPGTFMAEYVKAVCDPGFKFPLAAGGEGNTTSLSGPTAAAPPTADAAATPDNPPLRPAQPLPPRGAAVGPAPGKPSAKALAASRADRSVASAKASGSVAGGPRVQIGAFKTEAEAKAKAASQAKGHATEAEPVEVKGATLYRALLGGFASKAEAEAFCKTLTAAGKACIVRGKAP